MARVDKIPSSYPLQAEARKHKDYFMSDACCESGSVPYWGISCHLPPTFWEFRRAQRRKQRKARTGHPR